MIARVVTIPAVKEKAPQNSHGSEEQKDLAPCEEPVEGSDKRGSDGRAPACAGGFDAFRQTSLVSWKPGSEDARQTWKAAGFSCAKQQAGSDKGGKVPGEASGCG